MAEQTEGGGIITGVPPDNVEEIYDVPLFPGEPASTTFVTEAGQEDYEEYL